MVSPPSGGKMREEMCSLGANLADGPDKEFSPGVCWDAIPAGENQPWVKSARRRA